MTYHFRQRTSRRTCDGLRSFTAENEIVLGPLRALDVWLKYVALVLKF